jgi:hypothetical protein
MVGDGLMRLRWSARKAIGVSRNPGCRARSQPGRGFGNRGFAPPQAAKNDRFIKAVDGLGDPQPGIKHSPARHLAWPP